MSRQESVINVEQTSCVLPNTKAARSTSDDGSEAADYITSGHLIKVDDCNRKKSVPFMSIPTSAAIDCVLDQFARDWKISVPRIVVIVISNPECLSDWTNRSEIDSFVKGLVKALKATEMWMCTSGLNLGISKKIGAAMSLEINRRKLREQEARHTYPQTALFGICRQETLSFADKIQGDSKKVHAKSKSKEEKVEKHDIDFNHEYFLLLKDKSHGSSSVTDFLLNFESHLVKRSRLLSASQNWPKDDPIETPVIVILVRGNVDSIDFVLSHLKLCLPLIILRGSGGLADLLAYADDQVNWSEYREPAEYAEYVEKFLKPEMSQKICQVFPELENENLFRSLLCDKIFDCLRCGYQPEVDYITVLNVKNPNCRLDHLPEHLLRALLKSQHSDYLKNPRKMTKALHLAIDWNRPHVAIDEVFAKGSGSSFRIDDETFFRALTKQDRQDFVTIFLRKGFVVHKFLNTKMLLQLFQFSMNSAFFKKIVWEGASGFTSKQQIQSSYFDEKLNNILKEFTGIPYIISTSDLDFNSFENYGEYTEVEAEQKAIQVLIIWAIFSYKISLAKAIWKESQQPVHLALMCSVLLNKLESFIMDSDYKNDVLVHSKQFSKMACDALTTCNKELSCRADDALYEENVVWSYKSLIEIAAYAKNRSFMAHPCCQKWLDNLFMGHIKIRHSPYGEMMLPEWLKIILSAFLIFPMYIWIRFDVPEQSTNQLRERINYLISERFTEHYHEHGINARDHNGKPFYTGRRKHLSIREKIYYMWSAPITKFWVHQVFYFLYLALLSLATIWPSCGNPFLDFILCIWTTVMIMDSIYSTYSLHKKYPSISLVYKCFEIILMTIFTILYVLGRLFQPGMILSAYHSKIILCVGLMFFYYRIMSLSMPISSQMGPMLYRVKRMTLVDFANFTRIALLVMISNGIILQAVVYPDYPMGPELFFKALHRAWTSLFTAPTRDLGRPDPKCIQLKKYEGEDYYVGFKNNRCRAGRFYGDTCPSPGIWPYIFGVQYLMLLRLILLTILTALFSNTQTILEAAGDDIWKYQRFELIVNFAHSLRLPAPFSLISYFMMAIKTLFSRAKETDGNRWETDGKSNVFRYRHWKLIARNYDFKEEDKKKNKGLPTKDRMKNMSVLVDTINQQRLMIHEEESQLNELHYEIQNIQLYLQTDTHSVSVRELLRMKKVPQMYSRRTPYVNTRVHRTPVIDKRVPWSSPWLNYHPIAFNRFQHLFPKSMSKYLDINVHAKRETEGDYFQMPVFQWNSTFTSPDGLYLDRQSWITDKDGKIFIYEIDSEGLPRNPMGRTGLRGKGCLPRWGPNHFVFIIITQCHESLTKVTGQFLKVAIQTERKMLSLLGGFVGTENRYEVVQDCFKCIESWSGKDDMVSFLKQASSNPEDEKQFKSEIIQIGYLDEALNTDQAWCEAEVWHFHFVRSQNLDEKLQENISWKVVSDELLKKLTIGQAALLYKIAKELKAIL